MNRKEIKEFLETLHFHGYIDHDITKLENLIDDYYPKQLPQADVSGSFPYSIYEEELNKITQLPQTQTSLMKQCEILRIFANKLGLYDAADFLRNDR
nr:hypothetical protein [uncultured Flavobacterium sp.]